MKKEEFLVVTFSDEDKAIEASHQIEDMAAHGDIGLGYLIMLRKGKDGKVEALKKESTGGKDTWIGMFVGMLVGLFLGPLGFLISSLAGMGIGAGLDASQHGFEDNFTRSVQEKLDNGLVAVVANVSEPNKVFVDNAMSKLGGQVSRTMATGK